MILQGKNIFKAVKKLIVFATISVLVLLSSCAYPHDDNLLVTEITTSNYKTNTCIVTIKSKSSKDRTTDPITIRCDCGKFKVGDKVSIEVK